MKKLSFLLMLFAFALGFSQPTTNAPTPTRLQANVVSVFSDTYNNIATNYNPGWGQSGAVNTSYVAVAGSGNNILAYTNFNYQGTEVTAQDLSTMEYLHVDVWTNADPAKTILQVSPINNGTGANETLVTINYNQGTWTSVDIPKSSFTNMTWNNVFQMKFAANGAGSTVPADIYLDNVYFWKAPVTVANDASLSDLKVDGTTVSGFSAGTLTYNINYPTGTTTIPQITAATTSSAVATKTITQASAIPGTATVKVVSQDGTVTKTYTVNYTVSGPNVAAPTPPARATGDVYSYFSDAYTNLTPINWNPGWSGGISQVSTIQVKGNNTLQVTKGGDVYFAGDASGAPHMNLSTFQFMHIDYWIDDTTVGQVLNPKLSQWNGGSGEANGYLYTNPISTTGKWVSLDIPLSSFTATTNLYDVAQVVFQNNSSSIYLDNIYFYKGTPLAVSDVNSKNGFRIYPNPASQGDLVTISTKVKSVDLYDLTGKKVRTSTSQNIGTSGLAKGIYLVKTTSENGQVQSSKLIVK